MLLVSFEVRIHSFDNLEIWSKDKLHITCVFSNTSHSEDSFNVYWKILN